MVHSTAVSLAAHWAVTMAESMVESTAETMAVR
jgi:hypothetical protein